MEQAASGSDIAQGVVDSVCPICQDDLAEPFRESPPQSRRLVKLDPCLHVMHLECLQGLVDRNDRRCPLDRSTIISCIEATQQFYGLLTAADVTNTMETDDATETNVKAPLANLPSHPDNAPNWDDILQRVRTTLATPQGYQAPAAVPFDPAWLQPGDIGFGVPQQAPFMNPGNTIAGAGTGTLPVPAGAQAPPRCCT